MCENEFVKYLNTLHNYHAQNSNVFGEKNFNNKYYKDVMVEIPICDLIIKRLSQDEPNMVILTGHVGDGKTSLMYQVLDKLNISFDGKSKFFYVDLPNEKKCLCIKDFSEFSLQEKINMVKQGIKLQKEGNYVFLIANTGPLINDFSRAFDEENDSYVKTRIIDLLDKNTGNIENFFGIKVSMINIVAVNNAFFARDFINNIINCKLWQCCQRCNKHEYCPILRNVQLLNSNKESVCDFIYNHYIWLSEYGERLTIRSMTQQLSFMITGGLDCASIRQYKDTLLLSSNLFFGYRGTKIDRDALEINAIKETFNCGYTKKRWRSEEGLFINEKYDELFSKDAATIIKNDEPYFNGIDGWHDMIKRMYLFYNIQTDPLKKSEDLEDIFSKQFENYKNIKYEIYK